MRLLSIVLVGCFISILLVNKTGSRLERFEIRVYQKIAGKKPQHIQLDSAGVPVVYYEGNLGIQYNVVSVAEEAICLSSEHDSANLNKFFTCINWLENNNVTLNDSSIIFYNYYDWGHYKMKAPWRSAMNQGRVMQSFIRAFEKTGDSIYLDYTRRSMNTLFTPVDQGGVSYFDKSGIWYEEYADDSAPQSRVLNGMIVVLQALSDYHKLTKDSDALYLYSEGVSAVKNTLHKYDNNGHSNYDISGKPANTWYHDFHIELLGFLYSETNDPVFNEYKQKWMNYKAPPYLTSLYRKPTNIGIFTVFTIFTGVFIILFIISHLFWFRK